MKKVFLKVLKWGMIAVLLLGLAAAAGMAYGFWHFSRDLPHILTRDDFQPPQMTRIYSADDEVIGEFFTPGSRRTVMPLEEIPRHVLFAFLAAEDSDFMTHAGIDYLGLVRAFYNAVRHDTGMRGTSTITQQVVKNLILTPERDISRKIKEIMLARELEKNLSKEDILFLYLNTIYLGHGVNGVEEAAWRYFGKSIKDVTIAEAALLAGLTQSPERLTPYRHPDRAKNRRSYVLRQLWEKGFIPEAEYRLAEESEIELTPPAKTWPHLGLAPHFVDWVRRDLVRKYGEEAVEGGGLRVYTTLDTRAQRSAVESLRDGLHAYDERQGLYGPARRLTPAEIEKFKRDSIADISRGIQRNHRYLALVEEVLEKDQTLRLLLGDREVRLSLTDSPRVLGSRRNKDKPLTSHFEPGHLVRVVFDETPATGTLLARFAPGPQGGVVSMDPEHRHVLALVGSYEFHENQYNHVTQANRQSGSTFKPIVYAAAFERSLLTPASILLDSPTVFPMPGGKTWSPSNSDNQWRGPIRIREALGASRNVVSVRVLQEVGIDNAIDFARRIGIHSPLNDNFTMVMGSSEITLLELTNAYGTFASGGWLSQPVLITRVTSVSGDEEVFSHPREQVISEEVAWLTTSVMRAGIDGYTDATGRRRGGTASSLTGLGHPVAGKTGTTNEARDAWFVGYTVDTVTGVWVGYPDNLSLGRREYGGRVAAPIWLNFMKEHLKDKEPANFERPAVGITSARIDPRTGLLVRSGGIEEYFLVGTTPNEYAPEEDGVDQGDFLLHQFAHPTPVAEEDAPVELPE